MFPVPLECPIKTENPMLLQERKRKMKRKDRKMPRRVEKKKYFDGYRNWSKSFLYPLRLRVFA